MFYWCLFVQKTKLRQKKEERNGYKLDVVACNKNCNLMIRSLHGGRSRSVFIFKILLWNQRLMQFLHGKCWHLMWMGSWKCWRHKVFCRIIWVKSEKETTTHNHTNENVIYNFTVPSHSIPFSVDHFFVSNWYWIKEFQRWKRKVRAVCRFDKYTFVLACKIYLMKQT